MQIADLECRVKGGAFFLQFAFCSALKVVLKVGIAPTSPRLQRGADLSQLLEDGRPAR
jgi:hypothetical protein